MPGMFGRLQNKLGRLKDGSWKAPETNSPKRHHMGRSGREKMTISLARAGDWRQTTRGKTRLSGPSVGTVCRDLSQTACWLLSYWSNRSRNVWSLGLGLHLDCPLASQGMPGRSALDSLGPDRWWWAVLSKTITDITSAPFSDHPIIYLMVRQLLVRRWGLAGQLIDERERDT